MKFEIINPYFFPLEKTTCRSKVINLDWLPSHGDGIYYTQLAQKELCPWPPDNWESHIQESLIGSDALLHPVLFQSSEFSPEENSVIPGNSGKSKESQSESPETSKNS